jgi:hypothetical protein
LGRLPPIPVPEPPATMMAYLSIRAKVGKKPDLNIKAQYFDNSEDIKYPFVITNNKK